MADIHPDVQAALDMARDLRNRIADLRERIDGVRGRLTSPKGYAVAEVDAMGRLTGLQLLNNATTQLSGHELAQEILAAIRESATDAGRQYDAIMNSDTLMGDDVREA